MDFDNYSFFAFSKYSVDKNITHPEIITYNSYCYETSIGWYHTKDKTKWGCYKAIKIGVEKNKITYTREKNLTDGSIHFVDPVSSLHKQSEKMRFKRLRSYGFGSDLSLMPDYNYFSLQNINEHISNVHKKYFENLNLIKKHWNAELYPGFMNMTLQELNNFAGFRRQDKHMFVQEQFRFKSSK